MGVENFVDNAVAGKRSTKRARVLIAAKIQNSGGEIEVRLRDLSRKGALIECDVPLTVGSEVMFFAGLFEIGWAIGLTIHALSAFGMIGLLGRDWEERRLKELMEEERRRI